MALTSMSRMLADAFAERYAVGAFNIVDYNSLHAVIDSARELQAPVIIQTSVKTVTFWGPDTISAWVREMAERVPVPVALHLDHCRDIATIRTCIDAGWTSVMIDASSRPFEENLALTQEVVALARRRQVSVEAELGEIGGVEDDISVDDDNAHLVDPEKAVRFCREVALDCFAPGIGTAHGLYKGEPKIAFDRLGIIAEQVDVPLALHGGTGLSDEVFRRCIALGCAKINISTQLKHAFIDGFVSRVHEHPSEYNPLTALDSQYRQIARGIREKILLFGSAGKASFSST